ncbi:hypothetical protein SAMN04487760_10587 [Lachnospiraceae bacterium G41]|nr:hypothetical protein SAMN04487760_10587 [Lachnospiraceae bacterium G41]
MKKQIKNKNTARAIAFVLATVVMATSIPMTALAEGENTEEFTLTEENKTSDIDDATTESNELDGSETKATLDSANLASESVNKMENVIKAENNDLGIKDYADKVDEIYEDLDKASELVYNISSKEDGEEGYVANLEQQIENALVAGEKIDNILQGVSAEDGKVLVDVPVVDENGEPATEQVDLNESIKPIQDDAFYNDEKTGLNAGLDAVTIAKQKAAESNNWDKSIEERKDALTMAENQLNIADSILKKANEDVDKAQAAKDAAKKKLDEAIKVRDAVLNGAEEAEECYIKGAVKDSEAAFKAIKDAKDKAGELQEEVDELYTNIKNIELLEQIQAKQETIQEIVKDDQDFKTNPYYQKATKELCSLIIQYNILDKDGKDIELGTDFEVTLIQHDPEDLQNATLDEKTNMYTLGEKEVSYTQDIDDDGWLIFNADMENCFVVKFKDKDGKEYTRYYNYISNNDGSICVYERSYTVNTEDVDEVPAIEATEDQIIPAHWTDKDGNTPKEGMNVATVKVGESQNIKEIGVAYDPENPKESKVESLSSDGNTKYVPIIDGTEEVTTSYNQTTGELTIKTECRVKRYEKKTTENWSDASHYNYSDEEMVKWVEEAIERDPLFKELKAIRNDPGVIDFTIVPEPIPVSPDKKGFRVEYYEYVKDSENTQLYSEYKYDVTEYDTFVAQQTIQGEPAKPGIKAYTDETGITWDLDIDSILEAFENGYIKEVQTDDEENIISAENVDEYNYLILLENLKKYQEQKEALEKANAELLVAQEKFEALRDQTKKLKMYVYDTKELEYLENQVNIAESALADAKATRDKLTIEIIQTEDIIQRSMIPDPAPSFNLTLKQLETSDGKIAEIVEKDSGVVKLTIEDTGEIKKTSEAPEPVIKTIEPTVDIDLPEEGGAGRVKPDTPSGVAGVRVDNGDSKKNDKPELGVKTNDNTKFEPSITVAQKDTNKDVTTNKTNINVTDLVNDKPWDEYNSGVSPVYFALLVALAAAAVAGAGTAFGISRRKRALRENMKKKK